MKKNVALVGIGKIAIDQHVPAITHSQEWEVRATCSRQHTIEDVPSYSDLEVLLAEHPEIELVSLCVPPTVRFGLAATALAAGRHVMLEKPPGATLAEGYSLKRLAAKAGRSIFATWHSREAAQVAVVKAWLASRALKRLKVIWKEDARQWHPGQTWIWQAGGMGVFDPGINALSIVTEILADPIHVSQASLVIPSNCEAPSQADLSFAHPLGAEVRAEFDFLFPGDPLWRIEIETDDGIAVLDKGGAELAINGAMAPQIEPESASALSGEYPRLYAKMAALIDQGDSDMDLSPMMHVVDALALGHRVTGDPFHDPAVTQSVGSKEG